MIPTRTGQRVSENTLFAGFHFTRGKIAALYIPTLTFVSADETCTDSIPNSWVDGELNTKRIDVEPTRICKSYTNEFNDWYLPSVKELKVVVHSLYQIKTVVTSVEFDDYKDVNWLLPIANATDRVPVVLQVPDSESWGFISSTRYPSSRWEHRFIVVSGINGSILDPSIFRISGSVIPVRKEIAVSA